MVVPNTDLMDNHQGQLATELEKGGYLIVSDIPSVHQYTVSM
jgi:UDP-N-acetylglucosamine transferase subunit ALG13